MDQVRDAALQVIEGLADGEAFNIIDYSTKVSMFAPRAVVRSQETAEQARAYLARIRPGGGTNIHDALVEALRMPPGEGMLPIVLFLTDGLPTVLATIRRVLEVDRTAYAQFVGAAMDEYPLEMSGLLAGPADGRVELQRGGSDLAHGRAQYLRR